MNWSGKVALLALIPAILADGISARADELDSLTQKHAPYVEGTEFKIEPKDYEDLNVYLGKTGKVLRQTLEEAKELSGRDLHALLRSGIEEALETSLERQDLLLFGYVLKRALELDALFKSKEDSAVVVLLPLMNLAKIYYQQDLPRVESWKKVSAVTLPNWMDFAADQIPVFLKIAALSPSTKTRSEVLLRSLAWTVRSLNTSVERRKHGTLIVTLGGAYEALEKGQMHSERAMNLLLKAYQELKGKKAATVIPAHNYPASGANDEKLVEDDSFFPLLSSPKGGPLIHKMNTGLEEIRNSKGEFKGYRSHDVYHRSTIEGGAGLIFDGNTRASAQVDAITQAKVFPSDSNQSIYFELGGRSRLLAAKGDEKSVYNFKVEAGFSVGIGVWAAVEANQYAKFAERLLRVGPSIVVPLRVGKKGYVLIRYVMGWEGSNANRFEGSSSDPVVQKLNAFFQHDDGYKSQLRHDLALLLRLTKFFLNIEASKQGWEQGDDVDWDQDPGIPGTSADRYEVLSAITIPLGFIFPNDAIRLDGQYVRYTYTEGETSAVSSKKLGVMYELQW